MKNDHGRRWDRLSGEELRRLVEAKNVLGAYINGEHTYKSAEIAAGLDFSITKGGRARDLIDLALGEFANDDREVSQ